MLIPPKTLFLFTCTQHQETLRGEPMLVHPNPEATAVWEFDTSEMYCSSFIDGESECNDKWEVRA